MTSGLKPLPDDPMSDLIEDSEYPTLADVKPKRRSNRIAVTEIAGRLEIGRLAVYSMLEQGHMPGIRLGRRWIITRHAYEQWERSCGMRPGSRLEIGTAKEVRVC